MRVILHIGGSKCGSSAIQAYLRSNAQRLADRGIAVPGKRMDFESEVTGEQIWYFEEVVAASPELLCAAEGLTVAARRRGADTLILSAENLCNHPVLAAALRQAFGGHEVQVVFYVRRQDDFIISSWQQWHLKRYDRLETFLADRVGTAACWMSMILPWAEAFGDDCVTVRPFVRDHMLNRDVVDDFFHRIGVSQGGLEPLKRPANPSFDEALARLAHRVRDVFRDQHDNRFYEVIVRLIGDDALKKGSGSSLLDLATRRQILERYEAENMALKERFMPDLGAGPLFRPPSDGDVIEVTEEEKRSEEMALMMRCIYALALRSDPEARRA